MAEANRVSNNPPVRQKSANSAGKSTVKRFFSKGVEYCYHRPSGKSLPALPPNDPRSQSALRRVETEWRRIEGMVDEKIQPLPQPDIRTGVPITPDIVIYFPQQATAWLFSADEGEAAYYHFGAIATDQRINPVIEQIRQYFALLHEFELVRLRQTRSTEGNTHYYAIRTGHSLRGMPGNVLSGAVLPIEYSAINALTERQAAQSVARCLRDALGLSETAAREMRNDFINRGWITNGRPPEITDKGLSVIA